MQQEKLNTLLAQEEELQLQSFNNQMAWELGQAVKQAAEKLAVAVAIEVYAFEQIVFSYAMASTVKDNLEWIRRKRQTVMRFGHSSYYLGQYNIFKSRDFESQLYIDAMEYCAHGGSFPIRLRNSGLIGAITVSGLAQEDDHNLAIGALREVIPR